MSTHTHTRRNAETQTGSKQRRAPRGPATMAPARQTTCCSMYGGPSVAALACINTRWFAWWCERTHCQGQTVNASGAVEFSNEERNTYGTTSETTPPVYVEGMHGTQAAEGTSVRDRGLQRTYPQSASAHANSDWCTTRKNITFGVCRPQQFDALA